jgi:hypothetical protein
MGNIELELTNLSRNQRKKHSKKNNKQQSWDTPLPKEYLVEAENPKVKALYAMICMQHDYRKGTLCQDTIDLFQQDKKWNWETVPTAIVGDVLIEINKGNCTTFLEKVAHTFGMDKVSDVDTEELLYSMISFQSAKIAGILCQDDMELFEQEKLWNWNSITTTLVVEVLLRLHEDGTANLNKFLASKKLAP